MQTLGEGSIEAMQEPVMHISIYVHICIHACIYTYMYICTISIFVHSGLDANPME